MKRIYPILLFSLILSCACGETDIASDTVFQETTVSPAETEDELFVADELPDDLNLDGAKIRICTQSNRVNQFYIEESSGDIVDDAIYHAHLSVEERLNVDIEHIAYAYESWNDRTTYMNQVASSILADTDDFDILATTSFMADFFLQGYLSDISDAPYLDFDKPWWSQDMTEQITVNGVLPFITGDISIGNIKSMMCMFYNKQLHDELQLDDMYELVYSGKWTLDKLNEMAASAYADLNGDTYVDESDQLGLVLEGSNYATGFFDAVEMTIFNKTGDSFEFAFDNEHNTSAVQKIVDIMNNTPGAIQRGADDSTNYLAEDALFRNGNVLFTGGWMSCAESYRELTFDYGIIPYPKYDENQDGYHTTILNTYTNFALPVNCRQIDASCAVLEALSSEFYRTVTPAYFETALKVKYSRDDESSQMFDLLRESANYSFGMVFTNALDLVDTNFKNAVNQKNENWSSLIASKKDKTMSLLEDILAIYEEMSN